MQDGKHGKGYCCDMRTMCPYKNSYARDSWLGNMDRLRDCIVEKGMSAPRPGK
jgi:ribosome modulation factor